MSAMRLSGDNGQAVKFYAAEKAPSPLRWHRRHRDEGGGRSGIGSGVLGYRLRTASKGNNGATAEVRSTSVRRPSRRQSCGQSFRGGDLHGGQILQSGSAGSPAETHSRDSARRDAGRVDADEIRRGGGR